VELPCAFAPDVCNAPPDAPAAELPDEVVLEEALRPLLAGRSCGAPLLCEHEPQPEAEALGTLPAGLRVEAIAERPLHGLWLVAWSPVCTHRDGGDLLLTALAADPGAPPLPLATIELMPLSAKRLSRMVDRFDTGDPDGDGRGEAILEYDAQLFAGEECEFSPSGDFSTALAVNVLPRLEVVWERQLSESWYESGSPIHGVLDLTDLDGDGRADLFVEQQYGQDWDCLTGYFESEAQREAMCGEGGERVAYAAWLYRPGTDRWEEAGPEWAERLAATHAGCPRWKATPIPDNAFVRDLWGAGPGAAFAVGIGGTIARWDGEAWRSESASTEWSLHGVWGSAADDVFAVGEAGTIAHRDGSGWTIAAAGVTAHLFDVWGSGPDDVFAAGAEGTILHFDGREWTPLASGTDGVLTAVCGTGRGELFAVGDGGALVRCTGGSCALVPTGTTEALLDVWCGGPGAVVAVGGNGTIAAWDGQGVALQAGPSPTALEGVWGSGPADVWAVGGEDVLHFDGSAWTRADVEPGQPLHDVAGTGAADVVVVGYGGAVLSWDGTAWCRDTSDTEGELEVVWLDGEGGAFAAGSWATGIRRP